MTKYPSVTHSTTKPISTVAVTANGSDDSNDINQNKSSNNTQSYKWRYDNKVATSTLVIQPCWEPFFLGHVHYAKYDPHSKACDSYKKQHKYSHPAGAKPNATQQHWKDNIQADEYDSSKYQKEPQTELRGTELSSNAAVDYWWYITVTSGSTDTRNETGNTCIEVQTKRLTYEAVVDWLEGGPYTVII